MTKTELKKEMEGKYTPEDLHTLEAIEEILVFPSFSSDDALKLGSIIAQTSKVYGEDPAIMIERLKDHAIIFQYIGDNAKERNLGFAQKKMDTVRQTSHSSFHALVKEVVDGGLDAVFDEENECLPVGGAFPVKVNGELVGIIGISGLHFGNDQRLLVKAISVFLDKKVPEFTGPIV